MGRVQQPRAKNEKDVRREDFVVRSPEMSKVLHFAERVAGTDAPVLITGETGTGKELVAKYVHSLSHRSHGPFLAVNCGALPENLLESELFGYVKGAFTGADRDHRGLFEAAGGGSLFLDEIGEVPLSLQVKLLRVLQDREIRRVGSTESRPVDVRILTATNRNLEEMVQNRTFRKDLYYRLKVICIEVPPLRQRKEDILPLARSFVQRFCTMYHCGPCTLSAEVVECLLKYPWPGNVREVEHAIERAVVLAEGRPKIQAGDLPPEVLGLTGETLSEEQAIPLREMERRYVLRMLEKCGGNRKRTALALQIGENTLWRKLRSYGLVKTNRRERALPP